MSYRGIHFRRDKAFTHKGTNHQCHASLLNDRYWYDADSSPRILMTALADS